MKMKKRFSKATALLLCFLMLFGSAGVTYLAAAAGTWAAAAETNTSAKAQRAVTSVTGEESSDDEYGIMPLAAYNYVDRWTLLYNDQTMGSLSLYNDPDWSGDEIRNGLAYITMPERIDFSGTTQTEYASRFLSGYKVQINSAGTYDVSSASPVASSTDTVWYFDLVINAREDTFRWNGASSDIIFRIAVLDLNASVPINNIEKWKITPGSKEIGANDGYYVGTSWDNTLQTTYITVTDGELTEYDFSGSDAYEKFAAAFIEKYTLSVYVRGNQGYRDLEITDVVHLTEKDAEATKYFELTVRDTCSWIDNKGDIHFYIGLKDSSIREDIKGICEWRLLYKGGIFNGAEDTDYRKGGYVTNGSPSFERITLPDDEAVNLSSESAYQEYAATLLGEYDRISLRLNNGDWLENNVLDIVAFHFDRVENNYLIYTIEVEDTLRAMNTDAEITFEVAVPLTENAPGASSAIQKGKLVKNGGDPETEADCSTVHIKKEGNNVFVIYPEHPSFENFNNDAYARTIRDTYEKLSLEIEGDWNTYDFSEVKFDSSMTEMMNGDKTWPCRAFSVTFDGDAPDGNYYIIVYEKMPDEYIVKPKEPEDITMHLFDYWIDDDDPSYEEGNPWSIKNDGDDTNANGGINTGHALKFYHTSMTNGGSWSRDLGGENNVHTVYEYGVWNHSTEGERPNIQEIVQRTLADGYPKLSLHKDATPVRKEDDTQSGKGWWEFTGTTWSAYPDEQDEWDAGKSADPADETMQTESLAYLFDPTNTNNDSGKASYSNVTGLLQMNQDGYYYYDSKLNFAQFNEEAVLDEEGNKISDGNFTLYNGGGVYNSGQSPSGQFFPFNKYYEVFTGGVDGDGKLNKFGSPGDHSTDSRAANFNHHLGFSMEVQFQQPTNGKINHGSFTTGGTDMTFKFAGDDDIWVYVDDVLVLDMGGAHSGLYGEINFATGQVQIGLMEDGIDRGVAMKGNPWTDTTLQELYQKAGRESDIAWKTIPQSEGSKKTYTLFADGTIHTLKLFYMERGHWDSNFAMYFNLQSVVSQKLYKVDEDGNQLKATNAMFNLYKAEANTRAADDSQLVFNKNASQHVAAEFSKIGGDDAKAIGYLKPDEDDYLVLLAAQNGGDFDFASLAAAGQKYYLLEEVDPPTGYRKLYNAIILEYDSEKQTLKVLNKYEVGAYASFAAILEDNLSQLYYANSYYTEDAEGNGDFSILESEDEKISDQHQRDALLFAVPMIYTDIGDGSGTQWYPIYGSNTYGYNVVNIYSAKESTYWNDADDPESDNRQEAYRWALRHNLLAAALRQAADRVSPDWYFQCEDVSNSSDEDVSMVRLRAELTNLPGDADRYLLNSGGKKEAVGGADLRLVGLLVDAEALAAFTGMDEIRSTEDDVKFQMLQDYLNETSFGGTTFKEAWDAEYAKEESEQEWNNLREVLRRAYGQTDGSNDRDQGVNLAYIDRFTRNYGSVIYIPNERRDLRVLKQDEFGRPLPGARFALFETFDDAANYDVTTQKGRNITEGVTGDNGILVFGIEDPEDGSGWSRVDWEQHISSGSGDGDDNILWVREIKAPTGKDGENYALNNSIIQVYVGDMTIYANASAYRAVMKEKADGTWEVETDEKTGTAKKELIDDIPAATDDSQRQSGGKYNTDRVTVMASVGKLFQSMEKYADPVLNSTLLDIDAEVWANFIDYEHPGFRSNNSVWTKTGQTQSLHFWGNDLLKYSSTDYSTEHTKKPGSAANDYSQSFVSTENGFLYVKPSQTTTEDFTANHAGEDGTLISRRDDLYENGMSVDISDVFSPANIIVVRDVPGNTKIETDPGENEMTDVGDIVTYQIIWENNAQQQGTGASLPAVITIQDKLDPGVDFAEAVYENVSLTAEMVAAGKTENSDTLKGSNQGQKITITYDPDAHRVTWVIDQAYVGQSATVTLRVKVNENAKKAWSYPEDKAALDQLYAEGYTDDFDSTTEDLDHQIVNKARIKINPENNPEIEVDTREIYNPVSVRLRIRKQVASTIAADKNKEWHFDVTLTPSDTTRDADGNLLFPLDPSYEAILTTKDEKTGEETSENVTVDLIEILDENGKGTATYKAVISGNTYQQEEAEIPTITLRHDWTLLIKGLPAGTQYTVTEVEADTDHFRTSVTVEDVSDAATPKDITKDAVKDKDVSDTLEDDRAVDYYNEGTGTLAITKTVRSGEKDRYFTFSVVLIGPDGTELTEESYPFTIESRADDSEEEPLRSDDGRNKPMPLALWGPDDSSGRSMKSGDRFAIRDGDTITIDNLPPGTRFEIVEMDPDDYHVSWKIHGTEIEAESETAKGDGCQIQGGETVTVEFINSRGGNRKTEVTPGEGETVKVGDDVTYEIEWENTDGDGATLTIVDPLDQGVDFVSAAFGDVTIDTENPSGSKGNVTIAYDPDSRTITWTLKDLKQSETGKVRLVVNVNENAFHRWAYKDGQDGFDASDDDGENDNKIVNRAKVNHDFTNVIENPLTPETEETGVLHISKMVVGVENETMEFRFKVTLTDAGGTALADTFQYVIYRSGTGKEEGNGTITSGGELALTHGQEATIIGLPIGSQYEVEETVHGDYQVAANDEKGTIQPSPQDAIAIFVNYQLDSADLPENPEKGDLTVTKTGSLTDDDESGAFTFTIVLNDSTVNDAYDSVRKLADGTEQGGSVKFTDGVSEDITLKHGESITIRELPADTAYAVVENGIGEDGYHTTASGTHGTIKANGAVEVVYDNSPETPCEDNSNLTIVKMVTGNEAETDREFTFEVTFDDGGSYDYHKCNGQTGTINGSGRITLKAGQRATFDQVPSGTHYTVTEVEANRDGYTTTASNAEGTIPDSGGITAIFVNAKGSDDGSGDSSEDPEDAGGKTEDPSKDPSETPDGPSKEPEETIDDQPTDSPETPEPSEDQPGGQPPTGDNNLIGLWIGLSVMALGSVCISILLLKRKMT